MPQVKPPAAKSKASRNGNVRTTIVMPAAVHDIGKALAKAQRRSLSSLLTVLIEREQEPNGKEATA